MTKDQYPPGDDTNTTTITSTNSGHPNTTTPKGYINEQGFRVTSLTRPPIGSAAGVVAQIARSSHVGYRQVELDKSWFERDVGPLLGFAGDGTPVALVPRRGGRGYRVYRPNALSPEPLRDVEARNLDSTAFEFYPPMDTTGSLSAASVLKFSFRGLGSAMRALLIAAALIGIVGLLTPIAIDHVFGSIIPAREPDLLLAVGALLLAAALVSGAFAVVQGFAITRTSLKAQRRLQPAVWYRVVSLPTSFFRQFASGELIARVLGANGLKTLLSTSAVGVALAATFSLVNLGIILVLDPMLAAVSVVVLLAVLAMTLIFGRRVVADASQVVVQGRANEAHFSDILEGLTTIRVSGSEDVFYKRHLDLVAKKIELLADRQRASNTLQLFYASLTIGLPGLFFLVVGRLQWDGPAQASTVTRVTFVAFLVAFNAVLSALLALSTLIQPLSVASPVFNGVRPILDAEPETNAQKPASGSLTGHIEVRNVSFSYPESRRMTLAHVSFTIEPGQFVALVGPSGAGKSTIVRLLLGFEEPDEGEILYDGHNLADHDVSTVRSQLGVVLQEARVFAGSVKDNILGARPLAPDRAWAALDAVGLGDDVRAMPMGLETAVSPDGSTLSGGQIQRLIIARALVSDPTVLILDEATSSLDDIAQEIVTKSVDERAITRIVLAHRLSTIRTADKVVVVDDGRVVQQGHFDELMSRDGLFRRLVERQVL